MVYPPFVSRGVAGFVRGALVMVIAWSWVRRPLYWLVGAFLVFAAVWPALGAVTTLPTSSREQAICAALGTEAPCTYQEIARLRGTLTFAAADDGAGTATVLHLFTARGQSLARLEFGTAVSEADLLARLADPRTNWAHLIAHRDTWPALRTLARVTDGVPVIVAATPGKGASDHATDALASVGHLRVRIGLLALR